MPVGMLGLLCPWLHHLQRIRQKRFNRLKTRLHRPSFTSSACVSSQHLYQGVSWICTKGLALVPKLGLARVFELSRRTVDDAAVTFLSCASLLIVYFCMCRGTPLGVHTPSKTLIVFPAPTHTLMIRPPEMMNAGCLLSHGCP